MSRYILLLAGSLLVLFLSSVQFSNSLVYAGFNPDCSSSIYIEAISFEDSYEQQSGTISVSARNLEDGENYFLGIYESHSTDAALDQITEGLNVKYESGKTIEIKVDIPSVQLNKRNAKVFLYQDKIWTSNVKVCQIGTVTIWRKASLTCNAKISQERNLGTDTSPEIRACDIMSDPTNCVEKDLPLKVELEIKDDNGEPFSNEHINIDIAQGFCALANCYTSTYTNSRGSASIEVSKDLYPNDTGKHEIRISKDSWGRDYLKCEGISYDLALGQCLDSGGNRICGADGGIRPVEPDKDAPPTVYEICSQVSNDQMKEECIECAGGTTGRDGIWTAVGCIKRDPESIIRRLIQIGLGMGGGVSLLMTLTGGFILSTSQGDPQRTSEAKEMITSAVIGLLFVVFSVVILQFIGVTILKIPGFGEQPGP